MAKSSLRREENVLGEFFVDSTCIDCDTCRWMEPKVFSRSNSKSMVHKQPSTEGEIRSAFRALLSCPTMSIGSGAVEMPSDVVDDFPQNIDGPIYHLGFHSPLSFGAASYLVVRPEGNIMVDTPRFNRTLVKNIEKLGGVKYLFLTHVDDVADHEKFQRHFNCERWIHKNEIVDSLKECEVIFDEKSEVLLPNAEIIFTPGHTAGSCCLKVDDYLFTGDHLAWSIRLGQLYAFVNYQWDWRQSLESMKKLREIRFKWVFPAHGRRFNGSDNELQAGLESCIQWMQEQE